MNKTQQILAVLTDGPALTGEVAVELGWTIHRTSALLRYMWDQGLIRRTRHPLPDRRERYTRRPRPDARVRYLWTYQ